MACVLVTNSILNTLKNNNKKQTHKLVDFDQFKSNLCKMQIANSDKPVAFYSLDVIIAERNKKDAPVRERPKKL